MAALLSLRSVTFYYPGNSVPVFKDMDFDLYENERVGLVGANGCGKTTLLKLCIGLLKPSSGSVVFNGAEVRSEKDLRELRQAVGFVFQNPDDQLFSPTVLEDVAFGPLNLGLKRVEAEQVAKESLELVGLKGFEDRITHKLSGGEKRLVSLATILAMKPSVMLLDEPSTGLDLETRELIIRVLNNLDQGLVIVSHDWDFIVQTTTRYYTIENGRIIGLDKSVLHQHVHYHPKGDIPHEHMDLANE
ncbi:MAG: ABC transporter ATP-binding protein [Deltaproteobacteria bacterium]|nr:MAG: ABC transporter ATP-binding protein [Deltaproteobacteria bacterium]